MLQRTIRLACVLVLLLALVWLGWGQTGWLPQPAVSTSGPVRPAVAAAVAILLFPSADRPELEPVVQRIATVPAASGGLIGEVLRRLLAGPPLGLDLVNPFPAGTRLLGWEWVSQERGVVRVNLSSELVTGHGGGTSGELATVYALVNTLGLLPGVASVEIWVEGSPLDTLAGHLDLRGALRPDLSLIDQVAWGRLYPPVVSAAALVETAL